MLLVLGNILWLILDKNPPAWDQAAHLKSVILTKQWILESFFIFAKASADKGGNFVDLIKSFGGYPPLIYWIGGFWSLIVGVGVGQITFINTFFLVGAIIGVYKLSGNKVLPAILFSLFPVIGDISRNMLLDLPLLVWVVWGLYFWFRSEELKNNKFSLGLLVALVLASLTKLNGFLYFVPMVLILLVKNYRSKKFWVKIVIGGAIYSIFVGWWWVINRQNIYSYLIGLAGSGEKLTDPMNLGEWQTWFHYFKLFFLHQAGPIVAILFLFFGKKENKKLIWWTILTYVIFTIIKNKDFRFIMPLLVPVAAWLGQGLNPLRLSPVSPLTGGLRKALLLGLLAWMGLNYVENAYNWPLKKPVVLSTPTFLMGDINWINFSDYPVREYRTVIWPQKEIISDLERVGKDRNKKLRILVLINKEEINDNNLSMYKELYGSGAFEPGSVGVRDKFNNETEIINLLAEFDGVLVAERAQEPAPFYGVNLEAYKQARDWVLEHGEGFDLVNTYRIFRDKKLFLLVKKTE